MRKILCLVLVGAALCLGSLFLILPDQIASKANAQAGSSSPENVGNCPANATAYEGSGRTITCRCDRYMTSSDSVWGTGTYTEDSKICPAAVHAGVIGSGGGQVTFMMVGGQSSYQASSRNGVSSSSYGSWGGSYRFRGGSSSGGASSDLSVGQGVSSSGSSGGQTASNANFNGVCPSDMTAMRGQKSPFRGQKWAGLTCSCSAAAAAEGGSVWGTDVYTDDSNICRAASHAGVIGPSGGGVPWGGYIGVRVAPGQSSYTGTTRNGITTSSYGSWHGSFRFPSQQGSNRSPARSSPPASTVSNVGSCPSSATGYRDTRKTITCACSSSETSSGSVWGTFTYTDDSKICRAAVHEGVIGSGGGQVTFMMIGGQSSYRSSSRFGVSSSSYGSWHGSYRFRGGSSSGGGASSGTRGLVGTATIVDDINIGTGTMVDDINIGTATATGLGTRSPAGTSSNVSACPPNMAAMRGQTGRSLTCSCSAADAASGNESVWGGANNVYTDDSKICRAALQAGAIGPAGGTVTVTVGPKRSSYTGTTRNGVSTGNAGKWPGSSYHFSTGS
ncbi:MAG: LCCL domain-containing protein [Novosphingobium sp.]|nr:LCCL domain-containing protein [Novosphingobium sp.]